MKINRLTHIVCVFLAAVRAFAAEPEWRYQLLEGSFLMDDCAVCARPSFNIPLRGSFMLRRVEVTPIATKYVIENAEFHAGPDYTFKGGGTYTITGDFAIRQSMTLSGDLERFGETEKVAFTNESNIIERRFPMLSTSLRQTNGNLLSTITLEIAAAPLREIWFSTSTNFTRALKLDNTVSDGDLLSSAGRIIKRNSDLTENFPGPTFLNVGLDAVDILPGAQIAFSTETKGVLNDGDFAIDRTGAVTRWQDFMIFADPSLTADPGLDALQIGSPDKYYFSTKQDTAALHNGDVLVADIAEQSGGLFKSSADLLARFNPSESKDFGLDAFYVWPNGEIWFSTATGFSDNQLGAISDGDLLSDAGYIVYRNSDLTAALQPLGDPPTNFGLDALVVITDITAVEGGPTLSASVDTVNGSVTISWKTSGRVFQVERARDVSGPWEAITSIIPELSYEDSDNIAAQERAFYRVRQW